MTNTVPQVGRIAIVQLNSTTMAYAQGYSVNESVSVIKEYVLEPSGTPVQVGQQYLQLDRNRAQSTSIAYTLIIQLKRCLKRWQPVTVICGPVGSSGGNPKDTYTGIISKVSTTVKLSAITIKKITIDITAAPVHSTW